MIVCNNKTEQKLQSDLPNEMTCKSEGLIADTASITQNNSCKCCTTFTGLVHFWWFYNFFRSLLLNIRLNFRIFFLELMSSVKTILQLTRPKDNSDRLRRVFTGGVTCPPPDRKGNRANKDLLSHLLHQFKSPPFFLLILSKRREKSSVFARLLSGVLGVWRSKPFMETRARLTSSLSVLEKKKTNPRRCLSKMLSSLLSKG